MPTVSSVERFDQDDPEYYCCAVHVSYFSNLFPFPMLAKVLAAVCILADAVFIYSTILSNTASLAHIAGNVVACLLMFLATCMEYRRILMLLLIMQVLSIAVLAVVVILLLMSTGANEFHQSYAASVGIFALQLVFVVWSFAVFRRFYRFLRDRDAAEAVILYSYRSRNQRQHTLPIHGSKSRDCLAGYAVSASGSMLTSLPQTCINAEGGVAGEGKGRNGSPIDKCRRPPPYEPAAYTEIVDHGQ